MNQENTYHPTSPTLSSSNGNNPDRHHQQSPPQQQQQQHTQPQPPPRLHRLPSYQIQEPNVPKEYSFQARASYDASPFFSPIAQSPSGQPSYFNAQWAQPARPGQPTPSFTPTSVSDRPQPEPPTFVPTYASSAPQSSSQPPPPSRVPFNPQPFAAPEPYPPHHDMARLRNRRPVNYNEDHNGADDHEQARGYPQPPLQSVQHFQPPMPVPPQPQPVSQSMNTTLIAGVDVRTKFPVARIKRIMQADEDVGKVAQATPTAVSKALELFMIALVAKGAAEAKAQGSKRVTCTHLKNALLNDDKFDFLNEICKEAPDEGAGKKGRAKSEAKSEDSEDDEPRPKKKGKKRRGADDDDSSD